MPVCGACDVELNRAALAAWGFEGLDVDAVMAEYEAGRDEGPAEEPS
jgi:hypothetical protein